MSQIDKEQLWKIRSYIYQKIERLEEKQKQLKGGSLMICSKKINELLLWLKESDG